MLTTVGNEDTIEKLIGNLILLERDAIAAYEATIDRLSSASVSTQIAEFKKDHLRHLDTLQTMAAETGAEAPVEGDMKELLTTGKVKIAGPMGDKAVLKAMKTNEDDTVTAYEHASQHRDAIPKSRTFFEQALAGERRHRDWMEQQVKAM